MEYYSTVKKNEIMPFATTQINLESTVFREVSDRERQVLYNNIYMWTIQDNTIERGFPDGSDSKECACNATTSYHLYVDSKKQNN